MCLSVKHIPEMGNSEVRYIPYQLYTNKLINLQMLDVWDHFKRMLAFQNKIPFNALVAFNKKNNY